MKTINLKIAEINEGFCCITYKCKNDDNQTIYYCLLDQFRDSPVVLHRSTREHEPNYPCELKNSDSKRFVFERPKPESILTYKANEWINAHEARP